MRVELKQRQKDILSKPKRYTTQFGYIGFVELKRPGTTY